MIDLRKIFSKNNFFVTFFILVIFSLDRFTKIKVVNLLLSNNESVYINDYLNLDLVWNTGIGFGLFNLEAGFFNFYANFCCDSNLDIFNHKIAISN